MDRINRVLGSFLLALLLCGSAVAQSAYTVVATRGNSAIINTPTDRQLQVGDMLLAKRVVNGQEIEVARVRVALIDGRFCGLKVQEPLADNTLRTGDLIYPVQAPQTPQTSPFEQNLSVLDELAGAATDIPLPPASSSNTAESTAPARSNNNSNSSPAARAGSSSDSAPVPATAADPFELGSGFDFALPTDEATRPAYAYTRGGESAVSKKRSLLGFSVAAMIPITDMGDQFETVPQFGVQVMTDISFLSTMRMHIQYAALQPVPEIQQRLDRLSQEQRAYLFQITTSIQPRLFSGLIADFGVGYYRQYVELETASGVFSSAENAFGTTAGLGINATLSPVLNLLILGSGNFYFFGGGDAAYLSFSTNLLFAL